jgi:hypothetical protein
LLVAQHFFYVPGAQMAHSIVGCLRSLLYQLFSADAELVPVVCQQRWNTPRFASQPWAAIKLRGHLVDNIRTYPGKFCLFLDGLDECNPESDHDPLITNLLDLVKQPNVKLVVSSRQWHRFEAAFRNSSYVLTMQDVNGFDISNYVNDKFEQVWDAAGHSSCSSEVQEGGYSKLLEDVTAKAEGVFIWVHVVVNQLCERVEAGQTMSQLQWHVDQFPADLDDFLHDLVLERISNHWVSETATALLLYTLLVSAELGVEPDYFWHLSRAFGKDACDVDSILHARCFEADFVVHDTTRKMINESASRFINAAARICCKYVIIKGHTGLMSTQCTVLSTISSRPTASKDSCGGTLRLISSTPVNSRGYGST